MEYRVCERGWRWVPVTDILRLTIASVDFPDQDIDWEEILVNKCSDSGFMHLVYSIMEHGWKSAVGWEDGKITEGHHRICAAILLCEKEIPTTDWGTDWRQNSNGGWSEDVVDAHSNWQDPQPFYLEEANDNNSGTGR